jgi:predicted O-methyltransferase YrrM
MPPHRSRPTPPLLVALAQQLAFANGFEGSCDARVGSLLRTLTALARGKALDLGTGFGVSAAWMLDGLGVDRTLVTVDVRAERCERVQPLFSPFANVTLLCGDWREALSHGPFGIAFVNAAPAKAQGVDDVVDALRIGSLVVLDGVPTVPRGRSERDAWWQSWTRHPRLTASELAIADDRSVVIATRVR